MATPLVFASLGASWTSVEGAAASVAGVTWQNVGPGTAHVAFTSSAPGNADAYIVLQPNGAFYDKSGSAKVWARNAGGGAALTATGE